LRERRKSFRVEWHSPAEIYDSKGRFALGCIVSNFSNGGARITGVEPAAIPDEFILRISPHSPRRRCRVVWRKKDGVGVRFVDQARPAAAQAPNVSRQRKPVA
jgi:hypothetical protein